ncbi:hypothetical protein BH09MYX1_BH09MYX1_09800 [soil metagenome]
MAKAEANKTPEATPSAGWGGMKLAILGVITLVIALSIIISLGSRLGGCMYLDGSH